MTVGARKELANTGPDDVTHRLQSFDWEQVTAELDFRGCAILKDIITPKECDALTGLYSIESAFRSRVVMARHGFGRGEYKYFDYPLPTIVSELRTEIYPYLAPTANRWNTSMRIDVQYPANHAEFIARCHGAGQFRPTPLILKYNVDDYNCLHQDLYGEHSFPLQVTILLSEPERDFTGGEFVLTEQRPRMQSRAEVVPIERGDAVIFAVNQRPVAGSRGTYRVKLRHGVSRIRSGQRYALGIILHDAV